MFRKRVNRGLGQFKLLDLYSNQQNLNKWIHHFRSIGYQVIVQVRTDRDANRAANVDSMIESHYVYIRGNLLEDLKEATKPHERRYIRFSMIGLRAFRQSNRTLVENVRKQNKENANNG